MTLQIRPGNYRGSSGHTVSGTHPDGRYRNIFVPGARVIAERVKARSLAGEDLFPEGWNRL